MRLDNTPYSSLKMFYHLDKIQDVLQEKRTAPIYIRIKPTNICNQNCYYCFYANDRVLKERMLNKADFIPWRKMQEIIADISEIGVKAVTFSGGGEPLCYEFIDDAMQLICDQSIDLSIITNGQLLQNKSAEILQRAKWVRISLDAADEKTYYQIRRVETFHTVIKNIERFAQIKDTTCELGINFVINQANYKEIYEIVKIAKNIGVNNIKFSALMLKSGMYEYHNKIKNEVIKQIAQSIEHFVDDKFVIINKYPEEMNADAFQRSYFQCFMNELVTVIGADCKLYPCHNRAYLAKAEMGNLTNKSFKQVWFESETIGKMKNINPQKECNFNCVYDQRNMLLNTLKNIDKNHINFI